LFQDFGGRTALEPSIQSLAVKTPGPKFFALGSAHQVYFASEGE